MDIEIFPHRILGTDTTEKVLNDIESLDSVIRTVIQGPRLPPQDEIDRIYGDRRVIVVNGDEVVEVSPPKETVNKGLKL